jgi:hypothetical protein
MSPPPISDEVGRGRQIVADDTTDASLLLGVYGGMNENFVLVAGRGRCQADGV